MADPAFWEDGGDTELQRERTGLEQRLAEGARLVATFDDTDAMLELLQNPGARQTLLAAAARRLPCFTWTRAAAETLAVLEAVGQSG